MQFSYYKIVNSIAPCDAVRCGAVHYYLRCGVVMPFCGWFWCGFCGLCGLMNTPNHNPLKYKGYNVAER